MVGAYGQRDRHEPGAAPRAGSTVRRLRCSRSCATARSALRRRPQKRFAAIWRECFERQAAKLSGLNKEDAGIITDAGEAIEALCRNPSRKQAEGYLKRLEAYIAEMEIEKRKKCRLYNAAGLLTGLFIALLVI